MPCDLGARHPHDRALLLYLRDVSGQEGRQVHRIPGQAASLMAVHGMLAKSHDPGCLRAERRNGAVLRYWGMVGMIFRLVHSTARGRALEAVKTAPDGFVVDVREPKRNEEQSELFHAICTDLAKSGTEWAGKRRTKDQWKVLLISGHAVATKRGAEMVPGLEGEFVNMRESSASMGISRMSSLIEYAKAWVATHEQIVA